jgi:16S rRNA (guanine1516-N2)-methyltransferase
MTITHSDDKFSLKARALAQALSLPWCQELPHQGLTLHVSQRLELRQAGSNTGPVYVDFLPLTSRFKQGKDLLAKVVGIKGNYRPTVVDATAGLGQDAFMLALYGCQVTMIERSNVIGHLLQDGLERAQDLEPSSRLKLILGDAIKILPDLEKPDVVYLDPMYPESKKTAAKRKEMTVFRTLVGDDLDIPELLELALHTAQKRVVLKRPLKAITLLKPNTVYKGSTIRFDLYLPFQSTKNSRI